MSEDQGGWKWQMEVLHKQFPGLPLVSGFRNNAVTHASGTASYHSKGLAVDVPPRMDVFDWIASNYPDSAELIFSPAGNRQIHNGQPHVYTGVTKADHYSHVHWAYTKPGAAANSGAATGGSSAPSTNPLQPLIDVFSFILGPGLWLRIGCAVGGAALLLMAFLSLTGRSLSTLAR